MNALESRIAALERSNRTYRIGLLASLAALSAICLFGFVRQGVPDTLKAKKFELVNSDGKVIASLNELDGNGAVTTFNSAGKILTDIVATKSGAGGIVMYDGKGNRNLILTDVTGGGGSLVVNNGENKAVVSIGHNERGAGSMQVSSKTPKLIVTITGDTADGGAILTYNADGGQTARLPSSGVK